MPKNSPKRRCEIVEEVEERVKAARRADVRDKTRGGEPAKQG